MTKLRLLPIVLFAASALLALKLLAFVTGTGGFSMGPTPAIAAGGGGHGEEEHPVEEPETNFEDPVDFEAPLDLAKEAEAMAKQPEGGGDGHGGGHGEAPADAHGAPADAHGEAPADAHGAPADAHGEAPADAHGAPADAHAEAPADAHGEAPADAHAAPADAHGEAPADAHAAPADAHAAPADAHAAPADAHGAPADAHGDAGGHGGAPSDPNLSTTRPDEFKPGGSPSEAAILEALSQRRQQLDKRETDIEMRAKLLDAAEKRLQDRVDELRAIQSQLGGQGGTGAGGGALPDGTPGAPGAEDPNAPPPLDPQTRNLISIYEGMKPKSAATVFNSLDLPVLLPMVKNMNPRKVGPILAAMDPKKAAIVTAAMALTANQKPVIVRVEAPPPAAVPLTSSSAMPEPEPSIDDLPKIMPADPNAGG